MRFFFKNGIIPIWYTYEACKVSEIRLGRSWERLMSRLNRNSDKKIAWCPMRALSKKLITAFWTCDVLSAWEISSFLIFLWWQDLGRRLGKIVLFRDNGNFLPKKWLTSFCPWRHNSMRNFRRILKMEHGYQRSQASDSNLDISHLIST